MAGNIQEKQERDFLNAITSAVRANKGNPISISAGSEKLTSIVGARKYTARQYNGAEGYTDIVLSPRNKKEIKLSLKDMRSPSLAGGGGEGIETIIPGFTSKFMKKALKTLLDMGLEEGDKVPDVFCKIDSYLRKKIVEGSPAMGGPIDYVYRGPKNIQYEYNPNRNILLLDGDFISPGVYANNFDMHIRLRARREDQRFDPYGLKNGIPRIYSKSTLEGVATGRLVITDEVPMDAIIIRI